MVEPGYGIGSIRLKGVRMLRCAVHGRHFPSSASDLPKTLTGFCRVPFHSSPIVRRVNFVNRRFFVATRRAAAMRNTHPSEGPRSGETVRLSRRRIRITPNPAPASRHCAGSPIP